MSIRNTLVKTILSLIAISVSVSNGYSNIELKTENDENYITKVCNEVWQFTMNISTIIIPDKTLEPTDNCYCMIYNPLDQTLLDNITIVIKLFDTGPGAYNKIWNTIKKSDWWRPQFKVPIFHMKADNNTALKNSFYTYTKKNTTFDRIDVPVLMTFQSTTDNKPLIHLSCSPDNYALPDVLKVAPKTTSFPETTKLPDTTNTTFTNEENTQYVTLSPQDMPETEAAAEDKDIIIIASVAGALGAFLILLLIIIAIVIACQKRNHKKKLAKNRYYHRNYFSDINHNGIEDYHDPSTSTSSGEPSHTYVNTAFQSEADINQYSATPSTSHDLQPVRRVHYAEVEFNTSNSPSTSKSSQPYHQVTYADVNTPRQQNNDTDNPQANPIYAQPVKKHLRKSDIT